MATPRRFVVLIVIALFLATFGLLISCGGGGSSTGVAGSNGDGSVALMLADGPADDYDHIWIWITRVTLLPEDGSGLSPVVIFHSTVPGGYRADLLDLRDQDMLVTVKDHVPAGTYAKIRLEIADIEADGDGPCDEIEIKLPSGKIDLNPRGGISVRAGETLAIRLDIDADKSINLHKAGSSGKCIFRPVVFVEIEPIFVPDRCPRMLSGIVGDLYTEDGETIGFQLVLGGGRDPLDVYLIDNQTVIFDGEANIVGSEALEPGQTVNVRGRLDAEGALQASLVIIGDVIKVKGTVSSKVVDGEFIIDPDPGQGIFGEMTVVLAKETAIYSGCDTPVLPVDIQVGMGARIFGKLDANNGTFKAVAVFLTPRVRSGTITAVVVPTPEAAGSITIQESDTESATIQVPYDVTPYLVGDGQVPWDYIENRADCSTGTGVQAQVYFDPETTVPTAAQILIPPETFTDNDIAAKVSQVDPTERIIVVEDGRQLYVREGATIFLSDGDSDEPISLDYVAQLKDIEVKAYGIAPCPDDNAVDFYGFVIIVSKVVSE